MNEELQKTAEALGLSHYQHGIFSSARISGAEMLRERGGFGVVEFLKRRLKELNLAGPQPLVYRTKANWLADLLQGTNRGGVSRRRFGIIRTPEVLEKIIQRHLIKGENC